MKLYIRCQSLRKSDALAKLEEKTLPCMEALAQLWLFPNSNNKNHWKSEVWNYYPGVSRIKPRNKFPKAQDIFDNTWNLNSDKVKSIVKRAIAHEYKLTPNSERLADLDTLTSIMESYFKWISSKLSTDGIIDPDDSYYKLSELGL